ncbi:MAG TPA: MtnX-like HAD-IB family phosphatase [Thermoplasmata archaeon]|nr:MtnX-like HAD-IB family phosphatase [Thermoplasmata archaeon]
MPTKLAVLTDFDGTITRTDVVEAILEEFAPATWWEIEEQHRARAIGTRETLARQVALLRVKQADLIRFVDAKVELDETFRDFAAFCQGRGIPLEIVSEGLDVYVHYLLQKWGLALPVRTNRAIFEERGVRIEYPWADATCTLCGTCKLLRLFELRTQGHRVVYVGDGHSDLCPAVEADLLFAKAELARLCDEEGIAYTPFDRFSDVHRTLVAQT